MKEKVTQILVLTLVFLFFASCDSDKNIDPPEKNFFIKYYGLDGDQSAADLFVADDGMLLLGTSQLGSEKRIYLVKVDFDGNLLWQKLLGGPADVARDIEPTNDGNYIILSTYEKTVDDHDVKLITVSPDGNKIDSVVYGSPKKDSPNSVTPLLDNGFIVTGGTQYDTSDFNPEDPEAYSNIFHFRCNASLDFDKVNWYELYGATAQFEVGTKVIQESANRFYVFGYSSQFHNGRGSDDGKLNLLYYLIGGGGTINSQPAFLGDFNQETRSAYVLQVPPELGGGIFQVGTRKNTTGTETLQVSKLRSPLQFNTTDDEQFDKELDIVPRAIEAVSAAASVAGQEGFLVLSEEVRNLDTKNLLLQKITLQGTHQWTVSLGSEEENDEAAAVIELPNGKIIVLGTVELGDNQSKVALFKLNANGRLHE
jgi:hypothetical protein